MSSSFIFISWLSAVCVCILPVAVFSCLSRKIHQVEEQQCFLGVKNENNRLIELLSLLCECIVNDTFTDQKLENVTM